MVTYIARCKNCEYHTIYDYIREDTAQYFGERHMMKTGHIVEVYSYSGELMEKIRTCTTNLLQSELTALLRKTEDGIGESIRTAVLAYIAQEKT